MKELVAALGKMEKEHQKLKKVNAEYKKQAGASKELFCDSSDDDERMAEKDREIEKLRRQLTERNNHAVATPVQDRKLNKAESVRLKTTVTNELWPRMKLCNPPSFRGNKVVQALVWNGLQITDTNERASLLNYVSKKVCQQLNEKRGTKSQAVRKVIEEMCKCVLTHCCGLCVDCQY